jgi:hypothetical protein
MLLPVLIQLIFWLLVLASIAAGVMIIVDQVPGQKDPNGLDARLQEMANGEPWKTWNVNLDLLKLIVGLTFCLINPLLLRLFTEALILPFRINSTLTDVRNALLEAAEREPRPAPASAGPAVPRAMPPRPTRP